MKQYIDTTVAVLGAGLVGSAAALELGRRGIPTVLIDKDAAGSAASGVNYGGVRRQGRPIEQLPLAQRAHEIWGRLASVIGIDGEYVRSGHLKLARTQADLAKLVAYRDRVSPHGLQLEILDRKALRSRFPWIEGAEGGSYCADDGHANPRLVAPAFARAAVRAGAYLREYCPIEKIERTDRGFVLSSSNDVTVRSEFLLNCAGAWAGSIAEQFGEPVPLQSIYPNMLVTEPLPLFMTASIGIEGGGIYGRQVARGNCVLGGGRGFATDADHARPGPGSTLALMREAAKLFPVLRNAAVIRTWSGVEGDLPGGNPIIGPSATTQNLLHGFGFCGAGFQLAPAVGAVLADLVVDGFTRTPIAPFSISSVANFDRGRYATQTADVEENVS